jgi:hypothetical protein
MPVSSQELFKALSELPSDCLAEVQEFLEFIKFKKKPSKKHQIIKLGGLLSDYHVDISEDDISKARDEMWKSFGEK